MSDERIKAMRSQIRRDAETEEKRECLTLQLKDNLGRRFALIMASTGEIVISQVLVPDHTQPNSHYYVGNHMSKKETRRLLEWASDLYVALPDETEAQDYLSEVKFHECTAVEGAER